MKIYVLQVTKQIKEPLDFLEKDLNKLQVDLLRSGKIIDGLQNAVDQLRFNGREPPTEKTQDLAPVRRPAAPASDMDDGCIFSGSASGKSANVKVV